METIKFKSENNVSTLLSEGQHKVAIASVAMTQAKENAEYGDRTPQLEVVFKDAKGKQLTGWYNLRGYKSFTDLSLNAQESGQFECAGAAGYAVDVTTGNRIEDEAKTASALSIVSKLGNDAGIETGSDFEAGQLIGLSVGIQVKKNKDAQLRIAYTMPASKVEVAVVA